MNDYKKDTVYVACDEERLDNLRDYLLSLNTIQDPELIKVLQGWDCIPENGNGQQVLSAIKTKINSLKNDPSKKEELKEWLSAFAFNMQNAKTRSPFYPSCMRPYIKDGVQGYVCFQGSSNPAKPEIFISKERYGMLCNVQFLVRCAPDCTIKARKQEDLRGSPNYHNEQPCNRNPCPFCDKKIHIIDHNNFFAADASQTGCTDGGMESYDYRGLGKKDNEYDFYKSMAEANLRIAVEITRQKNGDNHNKQINVIVPGLGVWGAAHKVRRTHSILQAYQNVLEQHKDDPLYKNINLRFLTSKQEMKGCKLKLNGNKIGFRGENKIKINTNIGVFDYKDNTKNFPTNDANNEWFYCHPGDQIGWCGNDTLLRTEQEGDVYDESAEQAIAKTDFYRVFGNRDTNFNSNGFFQWKTKQMKTPKSFIYVKKAGNAKTLNNGNKKNEEKEDTIAYPLYITMHPEAQDNLKQYLSNLKPHNIKDPKIMKVLRGFEGIPTNATPEEAINVIKNRLNDNSDPDYIVKFAMNMQNAKERTPFYPECAKIDKDKNGTEYFIFNNIRISIDRYKLLILSQYCLRIGQNCAVKWSKKNAMKEPPHTKECKNGVCKCEKIMHIVDTNNFLDTDVTQCQINNGGRAGFNSCFPWLTAEKHYKYITYWQYSANTFCKTKNIKAIVPSIRTWVGEKSKKKVRLEIIEQNLKAAKQSKGITKADIEIKVLAGHNETGKEGGANMYDLCQQNKAQNVLDIDSGEDMLTTNETQDVVYSHAGDPFVFFGNDNLGNLTDHGTTEAITTKTDFYKRIGLQDENFYTSGPNNGYFPMDKPKNRDKLRMPDVFYIIEKGQKRLVKINRTINIGKNKQKQEEEQNNDLYDNENPALGDNISNASNGPNPPLDNEQQRGKVNSFYNTGKRTPLFPYNNKPTTPVVGNPSELRNDERRQDKPDDSNKGSSSGTPPNNNDNTQTSVVDNNKNNNNNTDTQDNDNETSYIPSIVSGAFGTASVITAIIMKGNRIAFISGIAIGGVCYIACTIITIKAYSDNKKVINNKTLNNNLQNQESAKKLNK